MKSRRKARENVFELLFEWSFKEETTADELVETAKQARGLEMQPFAQNLLQTTIEHVMDIDNTIEEYSEKWSISRISKVSLTSLRMALCEMMYFDDIPEGATINEAVELVKQYGTDEEAAYVNGILGGYSRREKADDTP